VKEMVYHRNLATKAATGKLETAGKGAH
jgi:hypothetical protein